jgi:hypothetical protein
MRKFTFIVAASLTILPLAGWAQQGPATVGSTSPTAADPLPPAAIGSPPRGEITPQPGTPLLPGTQTGLDVVASDGVSTKTVRAVPCSPYARETDGSTTCVGIPDPSARKR